MNCCYDYTLRVNLLRINLLRINFLRIDLSTYLSTDRSHG